MTRRAHPLRSVCEAFAMPVGILLGILCVGWLNSASAGGPLLPGSPAMGADGAAILWDTSAPVSYRVDGGALGTLGAATAVARVNSLFQVWQNVPTATINYSNAGAILSTGAFSDGDVDTTLEFDAVEADCDAGNQSPIVFDATGSLLSSLGISSSVIGFAGPCQISNGRILSGFAFMNGRFLDGVSSNGELTAQEFDEAFVHEFGHLSGLDHSQINVEVLNGTPNACSTNDLAGLPVMFPFAFCQARSPANPILSPDDVAWISKLYPQASFATTYGHISGTVFFSDGITHAQGVNVIARDVSNPRRIAFSVVSGYLFTGHPGQSVTGNSPPSSFGSRNPALIGTFEIPVPPGTYTVEVESIDSAFGGGSSVGPLNFPIPSPGPKEFWDSSESATDSPATSSTITVAAGQAVANTNIILNGTPPRFDAFESASNSAPALHPAPPIAWLRPRRCTQEALPA